MAKTKTTAKAPKKAAKKAAKAPKKAAKKAAKAPKKAAKKAGRAKVDPIPKGYGTVTATMNQGDAKATLQFIKRAFGGKVRMKMDGPGGKIMHSEIEVGDSVIMVSDAVMEPPRVASFFLYVENTDKAIAKAVKAGAKVVMPAGDQFWGDRMGRIVDPSGNFWTIATHVEDVDAKEMKKRSKAFEKQMAGAKG